MSRRDFHGRTDLRKAALKRKADARKLLAGGPEHLRGAMYLGGYAIECKLKAVAMEIYDCDTLRDLAGAWQAKESEVYSHGLEALIEQLPFRSRFYSSEVSQDFVRHVNHWKPSWRYDPSSATQQQAEQFLDSVDRIFKWLEGNSIS